MTFDRLRDLSQDIFTVRGGVWLVAKLCFVISMWLGVKTGDALLRPEQLKLPDLSSLSPAGVEEKKAALPVEGYNVIAKRNLFGTAPLQQAAAPQTKLKLRLVGTSVGRRPFAIIEDMNKNEQEVFELREAVFGQATLTSISAEQVRLDVSGRSETLVLEEGVSSPSATSGGEEGAEIDDSQTEFTVPEAELSEALANLPLLLSQARAVPYFRNGQSIGMRLFAIRRGSLYEKLGLKNGDIITGVNEQSLSDPSQALKLFEQLKSERNVGVKMERNGEERQMRYSIR